MTDIFAPLYMNSTTGVPEYNTGGGAVPVPGSLPSVTGADNGKICTVVGGVWTKAAASGSFNPTLTSSSAGQIITFDGSIWKNTNPPFFDLTLLGCVGDGTTDDTAAFQAALNSVGALHLGIDGMGKTYKLTSAISVTNTAYSLKLRNAKLDISSIAGTDIITFAGSKGSGIALTSNANRGDTVLHITSTSGLARNQVMSLSSAALWSTSESVTMGEMIMIKSVDSGTQITLYGKILHNYPTSATSVVYPYSWLENIELENVELVGDPAGSQNGIVFNYCRNLKSSGYRGTDIGNSHIEVRECYEYDIQDSRMYSANATGLAYGIKITNGSTDGYVEDTECSDMRYAIAFGGTVGVCRGFQVVDTGGYGMREGIINAHSGVEDFIFDGFWNVNPSTSGVVGDGVTINGVNGTLINGDIENTLRHGICWQPNVADNGSTGNYGRMINCKVRKSGQIGIAFDTIDTLPVSVEITDCASDTPGVSSNPYGIYVYADAGNIPYLSITNPHISGVSSSSGHTLYLRQSTTKNIGALNIQGGYLNRSDDLASNVQISGDASTNKVQQGVLNNIIFNNGTYGVAGTNCLTGGVVLASGSNIGYGSFSTGTSIGI